MQNDSKMRALPCAATSCAGRSRANRRRVLVVLPLACLWFLGGLATVLAAPPAHPGVILVPPGGPPEGFDTPKREPPGRRIKVKPAPQAGRGGGPRIQPLSVAPLAFQPIPGVSGTQVLRPLVLLLSFADRAFSATDYPSYPAFLFSDVPGARDRTMADYYREISGGKLAIQGDAASVCFVDMAAGAHSYAWYVDGQSGQGAYPKNAQGMVADALDLADTVVDFADFDNDGPDSAPRSAGSPDDDGILDALLVVHAGPAAEYFTQPAASQYIVSHFWSFTDGARTHDGVQVPDWAMVPERDPDATDPADRGTAGTYRETLGTLVHEFGHVLGLPDLYDADLSSYGLGHYDLMSFGLYGMRIHVDQYSPTLSTWDIPGHLSAWSKVYLGWVEPVGVHADASLSLWRSEDPAPAGYPQVIKVWRASSWGPLAPWAPSEYFLFEHRQSDPAGYDTGFNYGNNGAALVYHVDESVLFPAGAPARYPNNNEAHKGVDLEEAQNLGYQQLDVKENFGDFLDYPILGNQGDFWRQGLGYFADATSPNNRDYANQSTGIETRSNGYGPMSDADIPDPLLTVGNESWPLSIGYAGTERAGPFTLASATFDDGGTDPWVQAGRLVSLNLAVKHQGMPNTARAVRGELVEDPAYFSVTQGFVYYGDLPPLTASAGSGSFQILPSHSGVAFTWVPVTVNLLDSKDNFSSQEIRLPLINRLPAVQDGAVGTQEDNLVVGSLAPLASDVDFDALTFEIVAQGQLGAAWVDTRTGGYNYVPNMDANGSDRFVFRAFDGGGYSGTAGVNVTIASVNDAPVMATIGDRTVSEGAPLVFGISASDVDDTTIEFSATGVPEGAVFSGATFSWTPGQDQSGVHEVVFSASDGSLADSERVAITVADVARRGGGGGGCFLASAAWGPDSWRTDRLRAFRDSYLLSNPAGRWFVTLYYHLSPGPASWVAERPWARNALAFALSRLLWPLFLSVPV